MPIASRNLPENATPITVSSKPPAAAIGIAVCTALEVALPSSAPIPCATATPAPTESPINKLTIRFVREPVAPTAATESLPENQPTTIRSAALNKSCKMLVRIMGTV